jgi:hypothetical protein
MWVVHVERVLGTYTKPEIIDLDDGCLVKIHADDIDEDGPKYLADLLTDQAQRWAPRPPGAPLGPVIPVRWTRRSDVLDRFAVGVKDDPAFVEYIVHPSLLSQRAADHLAHLEMERSPYWQRVPKGYHDGNNCPAGSI